MEFDFEKLKEVTGLTQAELVKMAEGISLESAELMKKAFPHNIFVKLLYHYKKYIIT